MLKPDQIVNMRKQLNLSQLEAAQILEIPVDMLARYEKGTRKPNKAICTMLWLLVKFPEFAERKRP